MTTTIIMMMTRIKIMMMTRTMMMTMTKTTMIMMTLPLPQIVLLDVRTREELVTDGWILGSVNVPLQVHCTLYTVHCIVCSV